MFAALLRISVIFLIRAGVKFPCDGVPLLLIILGPKLPLFLLYNLLKQGSLLSTPLRRFLRVFEERYALILKEGEVAIIEDVAEVLPICLILGNVESTISCMVL